MGTRFLTAVFADGEYRVAQYGQWDGYPEGAGVSILHFLRDELDERRFREELGKLHWADSEKLKELSRRFGADEQGFISIKDHDRLKRVFPEFHRDTGEDILRLIQNGGVLSGALENSLDFAGDSLFCEWAYVVDFDKRTLEVYEGFNKEPLDTTERFAQLPHDGEYYPVKWTAGFFWTCCRATRVSWRCSAAATRRMSNMWKKQRGYVTAGGDPVWVCGLCGGNVHVYGIEHQKNYHRVCAECGRPQLYPWESGRKFLYYLLMRPVGPGCQPPGSVNWGNMDGETVLPEIGHHAWGWVEYDRELSEKEVQDYELAEVP